MLVFAVLCALVAGSHAAYSSSQYEGKSTGLYNQVSSGSSYADKFPHAGTGYNGGYTSHYAGTNGVGAAAGVGTGFGAFPGFVPFAPVPTFDFNGFYHNLQNNFANLYQQQLAHQAALFNSIRQQQSAVAGAGAGAGAGSFVGGGATYGSGYPGGQFAGSSASFGPGGFHQTAGIYPANPNIGNVDTRFGGSEQATSFQQGGPGFVGVSSFSSSSNVNGQTHREAITSVNDNGKITTHRVHS